MKQFLDENGGVHDTITFDGYDIADRVLEGVYINLQADDNGKFTARFRDEDSSYVETLNTKLFLKKAKKMAEDSFADGEFDNFTPVGSDAMIVGFANAPSAGVKAQKSSSGKPAKRMPVQLGISNAATAMANIIKANDIQGEGIKEKLKKAKGAKVAAKAPAPKHWKLDFYP
jgi:hypothetical protein